MWLVEDPWQLSQHQLLLPPLLAQIAAFCDGSKDIQALQAMLTRQVRTEIPLELFETTIQQLDEAYLLDNERATLAITALKQKFRQQPYRQPTIAGLGYEAEPEALGQELEGYGADDQDDPGRWAEWHGRAVVSPHIDYQRGGPVYAKVWKRAQKAVQTAELILIFATDHKGGLGSLTCTPVPYATPYGVLPTDPELVQTLVNCLGEEKAYQFELNHLTEHSVELAAVWLHHSLQGQPAPPVVPLLIGSFHHFVTQNGHPSQDEAMMAFLDRLVEATQHKKVLCVASVDLAHVGPAFDDSFVMDPARREALVESDHSLMEAVLAGDEERFYREIAAIEDANKVCGFSPLYLMLRYLRARSTRPVRGHKIAYDHCPADDENHSLVSICGLLLE